jgi:hypothetical protein
LEKNGFFQSENNKNLEKIAKLSKTQNWRKKKILVASHVNWIKCLLYKH